MIVESLSDRLSGQLATIYADILTEHEQKHWLGQFLETMRLPANHVPPPAHRNLWSSQDIALITYGDSVVTEGTTPLQVLGEVIARYFSSIITWVHVLPFHPWTSDDGFAVMDYSSVNEALGTWADITRLGIDYRLSTDG